MVDNLSKKSQEYSEFECTYNQLFGQASITEKCSKCKRDFGISLLMNDDSTNFICERCFQEKFVCSTQACGNASAFGLANRRPYCFKCLWSFEVKDMETISNIYDFWSGGMLDEIKKEFENHKNRSNPKPIEINRRLISIIDQRKTEDIERFIHNLTETLSSYQNKTSKIQAILVRLKILSNKDEEALEHLRLVNEIRDFVVAGAYLIDYSSFDYKNSEQFRNQFINMFMSKLQSTKPPSNIRIETAKFEIFKNQNIQTFQQNVAQILNNLRVKTNLFQFRAALMNINLQSNDYSLVESYLKYLDYYLLNSRIKCKLVASLARFIYSQRIDFSLSSRVGEKAIICFLNFNSENFNDVIEIALIVADSKMQSGKKKGILNLLVLAYNQSEKNNNLQLRIKSCELLANYYKSIDLEKSQRSTKMASNLRTLLK